MSRHSHLTKKRLSKYDKKRKKREGKIYLGDSVPTTTPFPTRPSTLFPFFSPIGFTHTHHHCQQKCPTDLPFKPPQQQWVEERRRLFSVEFKFEHYPVDYNKKVHRDGRELSCPSFINCFPLTYSPSYSRWLQANEVYDLTVPSNEPRSLLVSNPPPRVLLHTIGMRFHRTRVMTSLGE